MSEFFRSWSWWKYLPPFIWLLVWLIAFLPRVLLMGLALALVPGAYHRRAFWFLTFDMSVWD